MSMCTFPILFPFSAGSWKSGRALFTDGPIPAWYVLLSLMLQQISFLLQNWKQMTKSSFLFKVWSLENTIGRLVDVVMVWKNLIYVNWITHTNGETFHHWSIWKIYSGQSISELFGCCSIYANSLHPKDQETGSLNCIRSQSTRFISCASFWMIQFVFCQYSKTLLVGFWFDQLEKADWWSKKAVWMRMYESSLPLVWGAWEFPEYISVDGKQKLRTQWSPNGKHAYEMIFWVLFHNMKYHTIHDNMTWLVMSWSGLVNPRAVVCFPFPCPTQKTNIFCIY